MKPVKKYQPSNGTEGMYFTDKFCMNCLHCDPNPEGKKQCQILCNAMAYHFTDSGYPKEWIYDENDNPICTSWQKWDWDNNGDPDDPDNPNAPPPPVPDNQLMLFSVADDILQNHVTPNKETKLV
ncbi:hypothetical protein [Aquimarina sp. AU119]|uniref:hypothetical protein n=1 Tax=Aquimarina sp. AU119 TaxID=2108528 RepID=UPI000D69CD8F|nr:hypothetical protein [Aquimarina sp. AU119]